MVFPTVSYSAKINSKFNSNKKPPVTHPKLGPRHAPNIYDRIAAYDRAFQRCLKQDSKLSSWKKRMDEKGLPAPLIEGYHRSSSSWQHSLSSMSSESSSSSNDSYTLHRTKNMYDIKPMKSIQVSSPFPPPPPLPPLEPPSPPPTPKPSVSRRIINRLSLSKSKSTKRQSSSKIAPTTTQSLQVNSNNTTTATTTTTNYSNSTVNHYASRRMSHVTPDVPKPSLPRTSRLPPQKPSRLTTDHHHYYHYYHHHHHHSYPNNSRNGYPTSDKSHPPSPPPSPCDIDNYLAQKKNRNVDHSRHLSSHYDRRQKMIVK